MRQMKLALLALFLLPLLVNIEQILPLVMGQSNGNTPAAPTSVAATDGGYVNKIGIIWDTMRNATSYQVFRNTANDAATAVSLGSTAAASFFDTTAIAGQRYYYWVRAENSSGVSNLSAADIGFRANGVNNQVNPPTAPAGNPVTATKAYLGKALFWDEQLSSTRTVACGTCHHAINGGSDPRSLTNVTASTHPGLDGVLGTADDVVGSPGVPLQPGSGKYQLSAAFGLKEQVTGRRSMASINAAYAPSLFWDGRATQVFRNPITNEIVLATGGALESQVLGPPVSSVEMGHAGRDWNDVAARVKEAKPLVLSPSVPAALTVWIGNRNYPELFAEAFGTNEVTPVRIALAIATYERTLYSDQTPFDIGDLTAAEARGRQVFNASDCNDCHAAPLFTNNQFENTGIRPAAEDRGLFVVTGNQNDQSRFRTPSLRNVELRAPYMHNGRFKTLEEVVEFYNRGGDFPGPNTNRNEIRARNFSAQQKADLVAFLKRPLTDPRVAAEKAPFDRPMLYAESMRVPQLTGNGSAGTANLIPQVVALEPPLVGNPKFTVGVYSALGGAEAVLVIDKDDPGVTTAIPIAGSLARVATTLSGTGAGNGYGSVSLTIPNDPALVGTTLFGRWLVKDAGAAGGVAVTPAFQMTVFGIATSTAPPVASVSAASYAIGAVTPESLTAGFGTNFSTLSVAATSLPLPETLAGVTVAIKDVLGVERAAPLLYVSPTQINYQVPAGTATGEGSITIRQSGALVAVGLLQVASVAPGLFAAEANGRGPAAAVIQRVKADGSSAYESVAVFDPAQNRTVTKPIDLGPETEHVYLLLFGTGIRFYSSLNAVQAQLGGINLPVVYAGEHKDFVGLDQVNVLLPRTLNGRGEIDVALTVDGRASNTVRIHIK